MRSGETGSTWRWPFRSMALQRKLWIPVWCCERPILEPENSGHFAEGNCKNGDLCHEFKQFVCWEFLSFWSDGDQLWRIGRRWIGRRGCKPAWKAGKTRVHMRSTAKVRWNSKIFLELNRKKHADSQKPKTNKHDSHAQNMDELRFNRWFGLSREWP